MQTKPLYLEDSYLQKCRSAVLEVSENKIILDQTVFYPEGGGQPSDQGIIFTSTGKFKVEHVSLIENRIIHEGKLEGKIETGQEVECEIDWKRRYHNMQVHSAGHILHEAVKTLLPDIIPLSGQHGKKAYIEYRGKIESILSQRILEKTNELIKASLSINTEFVTLDELQKRSPWIPPHLPKNHPLRIIWIGNYPPIPDGGTQVHKTSEIHSLSSITIESMGESTRVHYQISSIDKTTATTVNLHPTNINSNKLINLKNEALAQIIQAQNPDEIEHLRAHYLGKKGILNEIARELPHLSPEEKTEIGRLFNDVKQAITQALESKLEIRNSKLEINEDLTLPGTPIHVGIPHPITAVAREMNEIFKSLGFSIADGPEIETDEYNYDRLNLPPHHPARDLQDSLYLREPDILLRTQTSSIEAHILATHKPPYRFVFPGKVYRYENISASNHMMFYQYQGVAVGEGITLANLKWTLETFVHQFFGPDRKTRFRCKYYPEVEPGVGVDLDCTFCKQKGCSVCKGRGWIEMLGAGMIHPNMLRRVHLDPAKITGFAWGMGLDRITMDRYNLKDIRALYNGDLIYKL